MKKLQLLTAALFAVSALSLCSCEKIELTPGKSSGVIPEDSTPSVSEPQINEYPVVLNGTEIIQKPKTVVSLTPAYTEILCEMGYRDKLIGVSKYCDYPENINKLAQAGSSTNPDIEKISELKPELVITATPIITKDKMLLEAKGIKILTIPAPENIEQFSNVYKLFGLAFEGLFDGEEKGTAAFSDIQKLIKQTAKTEKKRFVYITASLSPAGGNTFESSVLSLYGENCAKDGTGYDFPPEKLAENQPDVIFLNNNFSKNDLINSEAYGSLDAVVNDSIIMIDPKYFERPTARLAELLGMLNDEFASEADKPQTSSSQSDAPDETDAPDEENGE